jgi:hypothetical protein
MESVNCCQYSKRTRTNTRRNVPNEELKHHVKNILTREIKVQMLFVERTDRDSTNLLQKQN